MTPRSNSHKPRNPSDMEFPHFVRLSYYSSINWIWFRIMILVMIIFAVISSRIALLNILGYEFSAVTALITSHFTAAMVIRAFFRVRPEVNQRSPYTDGPHPRNVIWGVTTGCIGASLWLLFIPLVLIILLDTVFSIRNCDFLTGLGFYISIPLLSSFFTASIAAFCSSFTPSRRFAGWLYTIIILIFVARIILRIARGHTIGMHDPILGMFLLPLYNQETNLTRAFIFSRLLVLIVAIILPIITILFSSHRFRTFSPLNFFANLRRISCYLPEIATGIPLLILLALGFHYQGPLGMEITRNYLEHRLDGSIETEHFILRYPSDSEVEADIERVAEQHEFYHHAIVDEIEVAPQNKIRAYIYPDRKTKTFLTGVGSSVYAKPWTGEIHVEYDRNNIRSLKHELVHVISEPLGVPFFGSSLLGAYGEGIAEGIEYNTGNSLTHHQWAAALRIAIDPFTSGPLFPKETAPLNLTTRNFRQGGFYVGRTGMNYYLAASYTRWMLDEYGIEAYRNAYIRGDTFRAIGLSQLDTVRLWMSYLDHVPLTEDEIAFAEMAFAPPKFAVRVCAHELAEHERLAEDYEQRSQWKNALNEYGILLDFSPGNIRYGYQQALLLYRMEEFQEALEKIRELREWESADAGWKSYLYLLEGDVLSRMDDLAGASQVYRTAHDTAVNDNLKENAILRLEILNSEARDELLAALHEKNDPKWRYERALTIEESWLPYYYLGINLVGNREYELGEENMLECIRNNPPHDFVQRNSYYYLGICAYRAENYDLAEQNFNDAMSLSNQLFIIKHPAWDGVIPIHRLDSWSAACTEWLNRIEWRRSWQGLDTSENE